MVKEELPGQPESNINLNHPRLVHDHLFSRIENTRKTTSILVRSSEPGSSAVAPTTKFTSVANSLLFINQLLTMPQSEGRNDGPTIFRKQVIRYFKLHLALCNRIGAISFCWDKERNEFGTIKSKAKRFQFLFQMVIHILHNIFLVWSMAGRDMGRFKISYKMLSIYFTSGYCLCNGLRLFAWLHEKEIINLMNANFNLQEKVRAVKKDEDPGGVLAQMLRSSAKSQKALLTLGLITGISVPTLVFLILLANPCQPPFLGSIVFQYTEDHHCIVFSWTLHFFISLATALEHLDMVLPMVFTMFGLFFLSVSCLHDYIEVIKRKVIARCASEDRGETLLMYRRVQIMEIYLNACFRQQYFPLLLSGMTVLLIFCLYSCIRLHDKIPMPGFSYFPIVALNGIVSILVMNTTAANVLEHSMDLTELFRNDTKFRRRHWVKKMSNSLTPLKINFMMNFVDKSTPLIFINFSLNQVVSLLLVGSERNKDVQIQDVLAN